MNRSNEKRSGSDDGSGVVEENEGRPVPSRTRRAFVSGTLGASVVTLAGCAGAGGPGATETTEPAPAATEEVTMAEETTEAATTEAMETTEGETGTPEAGMEATEGAGGEEEEEELPEGVSEEEFVSGPVPDEYVTATSQAGEVRDPENLQTKEAVSFQEEADAAEAGFITPGPNCGNCAEYIPDVNGDGFGACAKVEGYIDPEDWCVLWESIEEGEAESGGEEGTEETMETDEVTADGGETAGA